MFKLLLVEDLDEEIASWEESIERYEHEYDFSFELTVAKSPAEAYDKLNDICFDGAIIDLKLGAEDDGGDKVIRKLRDRMSRVLTIVVSGTPNNLSEELKQYCYKAIDRALVVHMDELNNFEQTYNLGLTRILGGQGKIEEGLTKVFHEAIRSNLDGWKEYSEDEAEGALLRYVLQHLICLLDSEDESKYFPSEFYLKFIGDNCEYQPGSLLRRKDDSSYYVVMNPACDLEGCRTDLLLLAQINPIRAALRNDIGDNLNASDRGDIKNVLRNSKGGKFHWLPRNRYFNDGLVDFTMLSTHNETEVSNDFDLLDIIVSPVFMKDIVARFSSYYARQGQPEIKSDLIRDSLLGCAPQHLSRLCRSENDD